MIGSKGFTNFFYLSVCVSVCVRTRVYIYLLLSLFLLLPYYQRVKELLKRFKECFWGRKIGRKTGSKIKIITLLFFCVCDCVL